MNKKKQNAEIEQQIGYLLDEQNTCTIEGQGDGWVAMASIALALRDNDIRYEEFGFDKLKKFLDSFETLELFQKNPTECFIRRKNTSKMVAPKNNLSGPKFALRQWAYLGGENGYGDKLKQLKAIALEEKWSFDSKNENAFDVILDSYLKYTFYKLQQDNGICYDHKDPEKAQYAVFNTGLVDRRYLPIYALFELNKNHNQQRWYLKGFGIEAENEIGNILVERFPEMPLRARYFQNVGDMLYDVNKGVPVIDWEHIIIERIERLPYDFIEDIAPRDFPVKRLDFDSDEYPSYIAQLRNEITYNVRFHNKVKDRIESAIKLAIKRIEWNFKSAIPTYYPKSGKMGFLLPLSLTDPQRVDVALVVMPAESGRYIGKTIYKLDWAYRCARLICKPDSDWLSPEFIK